MKPLLLLALTQRLPLGLDIYMPTPDTNRLTPSKVALGRRLFFDKRLSLDGTPSPARLATIRSTPSPTAAARGVHGAEGTRNSPAILNRGYGRAFVWDGRAPTLERQALEPILNPKELGLTEPELERRTGLTVAEVNF